MGVRRLSILTGVLLTAAMAWGQTMPATAPARAAVPSAEARSAALALVKRLFKDEFARTPSADRAAFARKLLSEAAATRDDPAARYVLIEQAGLMAAEAGEAALCLDAGDALAAAFDEDVLPMKLRWAMRATAVAATHAQHEAAVHAALALMDAAGVADRFDVGKQAADLADTAALKSKKVALASLVATRVAAHRALRAEYAAVVAAEETLRAHPEDPAANLVVGRYYCLSKGQFERGLPHLARSADPALRGLARQAAGDPTPSEMLAIADGWWDLAARVEEPARTHASAHARLWYGRAREGLTGLTLKRIDARLNAPVIDEKPAATQAAPAAAGGVDMLARADVKRDVVAGDWRLDGGVLRCEASRNARVQFPGRVPLEYDMVVEFTRTEGKGSIALLMQGRENPFGVALDVKGEARLERVGKAINEGNPTKVPCALVNGQRYRATVEVRKNLVRVLLDEKELIAWKTDHSDLGRYTVWKLSDDKLLGVGASSAAVTFHRVVVVDRTR